MQILPATTAIAVAVFQLSSTLDVRRSESVVVKAVIDGDTIEVSTYGRVRLLGIDAPEIGRGFDTPAPFGREARDRLIALVLNRWVRLERDGPERDAYNRHLAYVMREDGVFVNAALVRDGLARVTARLPLSRLDELKRAEREAQTFRKGIWGSAPQIPSTSYTRPSGATHAPASTHKKSKKKKKKPQ